MFLASQFQLLYTSTSILQQHQTGIIQAFIFKKENSQQRTILKSFNAYWEVWKGTKYSLQCFMFWQEDESDVSDEAEYLPEGVDFYKMVFIVNAELNMGVGKTAAQVAHAALGLHRTLLDDPQKFGQMLMSWEQFG